MVPLLLNPIIIAFSITIIIACFIGLLLGKKRLNRSFKVVLIFVIVICIIYLLFILWAIIGFGSNSGPAGSLRLQ